jgi:hypothetical protein
VRQTSDGAEYVRDGWAVGEHRAQAEDREDVRRVDDERIATRGDELLDRRRTSGTF